MGREREKKEEERKKKKKTLVLLIVALYENFQSAIRPRLELIRDNNNNQHD